MAEFKVVSWAPLDPITDEKLDAMVSNDNYLRENMVTGQYYGYGIKKNTGVRIATGLAGIGASKANQRQVAVSFGNFFSTACRPIITTGVISSKQRMIYATLDGPGSQLHPTRDGFQIHVYVDSTAKNKKISKGFYVSWIAVGF